MLPLYTALTHSCSHTFPHYHHARILIHHLVCTCSHSSAHTYSHVSTLTHTLHGTLTHFHFNDPVTALSSAMSSVSSGHLLSSIHRSWSPLWLKEYRTLHNMPYSASQATRSHLYSSFYRQGTWGPERERYSAKVKKIYECPSRGNPRALK